ncbi:MFS transporter [Streptococcus danieliae]|uniref:MFS transporter n=1 Tax=Streptococcus danieliae TaxID=747656 RepID=A0A7Z0M4H7_9STRE|nr:MFS transporter [Streptococcus danieliae]MBF0698533.1 MFS transporter [Streptococcus danieliae]NYS95710.1 MFS transporter [Streptococcus danieliae]
MRLSKNDRNALISAIVASGTDDLNVMFLSFSLTSIIASLAISKVEAGWIATITNLGMLLGGIVFGILADRYNKFKVFRWTVVIFSLATALIFFTPNLQYLYAMRFIAGIGVGGEYGVAIAIMAGLVPKENMGRVSSINGIVGQIGSITSAALAGLIAPIFGWRGLFLCGLLPLLIVGWSLIHVDADKVSDFDEQTDTAAPGDRGKIGDLFKTRQIASQTLCLMVMTTVQIAGYFGMMNWLPSIIQEQAGVSMSGSSIWMITTILGMCLGMVVFGQLLDRLGPRRVYSVFLLASSMSVYLFSFAKTGLTILIAGAIVGFFVNGMFAGYGAMITRLYPHHVRSLANNTILNVGRAIGGFSSVVIGYILQHSTIPVVLLFLASLYLFSLLAMLSISNLKKENYQELRPLAEDSIKS